MLIDLATRGKHDILIVQLSAADMASTHAVAIMNQINGRGWVVIDSSEKYALPLTDDVLEHTLLCKCTGYIAALGLTAQEKLRDHEQRKKRAKIV